MSTLNFTPRESLTDSSGQPYFVWDQRLTLEQFEAGLRDDDPDVRARFMARLLRDARPDDVFQFVKARDVAAAWDRVAPLLGHRRDFWAWLLERWDVLPRADAR